MEIIFLVVFILVIQRILRSGDFTHTAKITGAFDWLFYEASDWLFCEASDWWLHGYVSMLLSNDSLCVGWYNGWCPYISLCKEYSFLKEFWRYFT